MVAGLRGLVHISYGSLQKTKIEIVGRDNTFDLC